MVRYPSEFGTVVRDLSPDESGPSKKELYVIETDDNARDFSAPPRIYGAFWSSRGPEPVNEIAIGLWPKLGDPGRRDCEDNVDGAETGAGECYRATACLGHGSSFLSMEVNLVSGRNEKLFTSTVSRLHRMGLLEEALAFVGTSMDGVKGALGELGTDPWLREAGALDPLYEIFGYPDVHPSKNAAEAGGGELLKFLSRIVNWRPEKRSLGIGEQFVVSKMRFVPSITDPEEFFRSMDVDVYGPDWENEADKEGFVDESKAMVRGIVWIRDDCDEFEGYDEKCPELAMTRGPWDSREMKDDGDRASNRHCRVEVMTKEQFACFLHNLMVKAGWLRAPLYTSPPAPLDWCKEMQGRLWLQPPRTIEGYNAARKRKKIGASSG